LFAFLTLFLSYIKTAICLCFISIKVSELSKELSLIPVSLTNPPPFAGDKTPFAGDKGNSKLKDKLNTTTLAPLNFDHVNDFAIQEGLTSVNTFRFFNTYKKTNWLSVNGNPFDWRERLREWDIDDAKNRKQNKGSTPTSSYKSSDPFTIYDYDEF
jgi:hypothetical protein